MSNLVGCPVDSLSWVQFAVDLADIRWMAQSFARSGAIAAERSEIGAHEPVAWTVMAQALASACPAPAVVEPQSQAPLPRARPSRCPGPVGGGAQVGGLYLEF